MAAPRRATKPRGFTLVELVAVLLLASALAAVVLPRMQGALSFQDTAWRDQVLAALRHAQSTARGHRRLVCADLAAGQVVLRLATVNPATTCSQALPGPDGQAAFARDARAAALTVAPAGTLYFQPGGRVTTDGAGLNAADRSIAIAGEAAITLIGETGHAQ
jgi:prepilin-type N-terminal cleavage/methylation domain-containing protein